MPTNIEPVENPRRDNLIHLWRLCCKRGISPKHTEKKHIFKMDGFLLDDTFLFVQQVGEVKTIHFGTIVEDLCDEDFIACLDFYNNCDQDIYFEKKMNAYLMNAPE